MRSGKIIFTIILTLLFISCFDAKKVKSKINKDNEIMEGNVINDSIYDGKVKFYTSKNEYIGYMTYRLGIEDGPTVNYKNGKIKDSMTFKNGLKNGFVYVYDSLGKLTDKVFYFNDIQLGYTYSFHDDKVEYKFVDFEGKVIYERTSRTDTSSEFDYKGSLMYSKINEESINGSSQIGLFMYIISPPTIKSHYEIAVLDNKNHFVSSQKIITDNCFYTQELPNLPKNQKYALVLYTYNPYKKRDDLQIQIL